MEIKLLKRSEFHSVTALYKKCFPNTLMVILGARVIQKFLEWCLQENHYFFVVFQNNQPVAFAGGYYYRIGERFIHSTQELYKYVRKEVIYSFLKQPWKLFHPVVVKKLLKQVKQQTHTNVENNIISSSSELAILSIGVNPQYRRRGIAQKLTDHISSFALENNIPLLKLTVEKSNKTALNFYAQNGWNDLVNQSDSIVKFKTLTNV